MTQYDNTNTAALWGNPTSLENEKSPIFRMKLNVDGHDKEIGLYLNDSHPEAQTLLEAFMDIVDIATQSESNSPILRGKVQEPYRKKEEGDGNRGGRASRRGGTPKSSSSVGPGRVSPNAEW